MTDNPLTGPEVSPRDVIAGAVGTEEGANDTLAALDRAGFSVVSRVWVAELDLDDDGGSYVSVHTSAEGAVKAVVRWAATLGIEVDDLDTDSGSQILDDAPDVRSYGITYVPVHP